jgi:uncharacterized membrane protein YozB (DUF420 family)
MWQVLASNLPHATASLNAVATLLLVNGLIKIKSGRAREHKKMMTAALGVSMLFLLLYLLHKVALYQTTGEFNKRFPSVEDGVPQAVRITYFAILFTHLPLAIFVPILAIRAVFLASKGRIIAHKKLVRYAFPIWMYVSVTGVLVYLMLYQFYAR